MDILEVKDLAVKVEGKLILKDVTFSLKSGASHILSDQTALEKPRS